AAAWHRVQARLAQKEGNTALQLEHWRAVAADQPLDTGAHRAIASLLELQEGMPAAVAHLRGVCGRFPYHWHLHLALLDWLRAEGPVAWEGGVRELLRIDPDDGWAQRELADALRAGKRYEEAHAALDLAAKLEPRSAALYSVRAGILEEEGRNAEAREACRRALELDADNTYALKLLIELCRTQEERLAELRFVQGELERQTTSGDGVLEFTQTARRYLEPAELLEFLRKGHRERPDLWETGAMLGEQLRHAGQMEEATALAQQLTEQFPLMPRVWMELGLSLEAAGKRAAAIEAVGKVRELNPGWAWGMRTLSEMIRKSGDYAGARAVLEHALRFSPRNALAHGFLADLLWHEGEKAAALEHLKEAVEIDPGYQWAMERLGTWGAAAGQPEAGREALQRLLRERPAEARSWLMHADSLTQPAQFEERLAALDKAMACDPGAWRAPEEKARVLALAGRYEQALQLCRGHSSGAVELRLREAWILHHKGQREQAVKVMEAALADDPAQVWGWQLLVEWHQEQEKLDLAEEALQQLSRLEPMQPMHLGYLARIQEARGKKDEARETLERSLEVAPDYHFGFQTLFWWFIRDQDFAGAKALVERMKAHLSDIEHASRRFTVGCRQKQWQTAWDWLDRMLQDGEDDQAAFVRVDEEVKLMPRKEVRELERRVRQALKREGVNVNAARLYVTLCGALEKLPRVKVLDALPERSAAGTRALDAYISVLARHWQANRTNLGGLPSHLAEWRLRRLIRRHREWLRAEMDLYGGISYALNTMERHNQTIQWLSDWRERPDLEPYVINNFILCLQRKGLKEEAEAVIQRGLTLPEHNEWKMRFHIWAAIEHALREEEAGAKECLEVVNPENFNDYSRGLYEFAKLLLRYQPGAAQAPGFDDSVRQKISQFVREHKGNRLMKDAARRACALAGERLRSIRPRLWFFFETNKGAVASVLGLMALVTIRWLSWAG
ncbi:MAG TPA: tetratricopeptide repeat protein, partial [Prosthecobacter sp.]|nr:tetratricopeptide repeat protein [Prosthecobacter sp.]